MPDAPAAPAVEAPKPAATPEVKPNVSASVNGSEKPVPLAVDPLEFNLKVKDKDQKIKFQSREQLTALLQKALYADQVIKDASQAKKGAEGFINKLKTVQGFKEVMSDPAIGADYKQFALEIVKEMMDYEKLTPEQQKIQELESYKKKTEAEREQAKLDAANQEAQRKRNESAIKMRGEIVGAMQKYPDIPQTQATMDAVIQNMRAAFKRFGKHLTPEQAMSVYSEQYWKSLEQIVEKMEPEQLTKRFNKKILDKLEKIKLDKLKEKMNPANKEVKQGEPSKRKGGHISEREFDREFQKRITTAGL